MGLNHQWLLLHIKEEFHDKQNNFLMLTWLQMDKIHLETRRLFSLQQSNTFLGAANQQFFVSVGGAQANN